MISEGVAEWRTVKLGTIIDGSPRNGVYKSKDFHGSGVKIVNMGELFANPRLKSVPMKRIRLSPKELSSFALEPGDLLFARRSLVAEGAGKCSIVLSVDEPTVFESSIIRIRPDRTKADGRFLFYFFSSSYGKYLLDTILRQVAVSGVTGRDLVELEIPLPTLDEQKKISDILSALDDSIELTQLSNRTLEEIAGTIFKSWFVTFDPVRAKAEGRRPSGMDDRTAAMFPDSFGDSDMGEIPNGWDVVDMSDDIRMKGGSTPRTNNPEFWEGDVYFACPKDMSDIGVPILNRTSRKITKLGASRISSGIMPAGAVLLSSRAPIGYLAITSIPVSVNQGIIAMDCSGEMKNHYVYFWTKRHLNHILSLESGTTFGEIRKSDFRDLKILKPPQNVMEEFEAIASPIFEQIEANVSQSDTLREIRDVLVPRLVTGKTLIAST